MSYTVYILYSGKILKHYAGYTEDFERRLEEHNAGKSKFTSIGVPWKRVCLIECKTKTEAIKLERKIKSRGIKRYLNDCNIPLQEFTGGGAVR